LQLFLLDTTKEALGFQSATIILIWPAGVKAIKPILQDFNVEMKDLFQNKTVLFFSCAQSCFSRAIYKHILWRIRKCGSVFSPQKDMDL